MNYSKDVREIKFLVKHLPGQHNQATHGRRFKIPGDDLSKVVAGPKIKKPKKEPLKIYDPYEISKNSGSLESIHVPKEAMEELHIEMKDHYEYCAKKLGISIDEYAKKLDEHAQNLMKNAIPFLRIRGSALEKVLNEGRFKSQFETNTSGGSLDTEGRAVAEYELFGYDKKNTPVEKRPIYGYFTDDPKGKLNEFMGCYGEIRVKLKPHTKNNATVTMEDSLGSGKCLAPKGANNVDRTVFLTAPWSTSTPLHYKSLKEVPSYPEAQYHNGLHAKDIDHVILSKNKKYSPTLLDKLHELNISYSYENE